MSGLLLSGVTKVLGGKVVIDAIDLSVDEGEMVCLLGPSGCGKTTTLRMVAGFLYPDSGRVLIDSVDVTDVPPERRPTAMVFQNYALWPHMSVLGNVAFGLRLRKLGKGEVLGRAEKVLRMVNMWDLRDRRPAHVSGGEQQRVALARALVLEPKLLLLDEPLSNLDAKLRVQVRDEIREIQQRVGITSVFVTHDQDEALSIADRVAVLLRGRIEQFADPATLYASPATEFVAQFVGTMNFFEAEVSRNSARLEPDGAVVPCRGLPAGARGRYKLGVRPEEVRVGPPGVDGGGFGDVPGGVAARVVRRIQRGHFSELVVEFGRHTARTFVAPDFAVPEGAAVSFGRVLLYRDGYLWRGETTPADPGTHLLPTSPRS
jgi:ABC-type Fe3+/spermidine/putrescine transport system ATPase subunit